MTPGTRLSITAHAIGGVDAQPWRPYELLIHLIGGAGKFNAATAEISLIGEAILTADT